MLRIVALTLLLCVALTGCATMQDFRNTCSAMGFPEGSPDHAYCTERERVRYDQAVDGAIKAWGEAFQAITPPPPKTCFWQRTSPYSGYTTCY